MAEVDTGFFVLKRGRGRKRIREPLETFQRIKRGLGEKIRDDFQSQEEMVFSTDFIVNPPKIAQFLEFTVQTKKQEILKLATKIKSGVQLEIENHIKELGEMVSTDPRLVDGVEYDLLDHLVQFLKYTESPNIQYHAIIILQTCIAYSADSSNMQWVMKSIEAPIFVNLICSEDCEVKVQAMCLLRTMALTFPKSEFNKTLEAALKPLSLLINGSTIDEVLYGVSKTLAVVCQVYPKLPDAELEMVIDSLIKLINHESENIPPHACLGLVYLCDGREEMVVEKEDIGPLTDCLIEIIKLNFRPRFCVNSIAALTALGTIVRWGSDDDIEVIIVNKDALRILGLLLQSEYRDFVENACWVISNITAGKENHIMAVCDSGLIEYLFDVVKNYKLLDVKKEAAWAISNAINGVCPDQIETYRGLRSRCVEPFWNILKVFRADQQIVSFCLEGLVNLNGVKVSYNGEPINTAEFKNLLVRLRGAQFQSADDTKGLAKLKRPRCADNIKRSYEDMDIIFDVTCTFKEDIPQPDSQICLIYREEDTEYVPEDSLKIADEMEVYEPKEILWTY